MRTSRYWSAEPLWSAAPGWDADQRQSVSLRCYRCSPLAPHPHTDAHTHAHMPPPYSPRHAAAFAKSPTPNIGRSRRDRDQARAARQRTAARADPTMQGAIPPNHLRFGAPAYTVWLRDQCAPLTRRPCAH